MHTKPIRQVILYLSIMPVFAFGSVQDHFDQIFNDMTNISDPGLFKTQSRGVISGGRLVSKNKIFEEQLVNFDPPSIKAGCGGIDVYGGSFSFIRADKIVELLRAVASNAKGYAFQLALSAYFPEGAAWMEVFQKKLQSLNQSLSNSCQLAKGLVDGGLDAVQGKSWNDNALSSTFEDGLFTDWSEAKTAPKTPEEKMKENTPDKWKELYGNVIWKALKRHNAETWLAGGNEDFLEIIQSLTGLIIVSDLVDSDTTTSNPDGSSVTTAEKAQKIDIKSHSLSFKQFFEGGTYEVWQCPANDKICATPTKSTVENVKSIMKKMGDEFDNIYIKIKNNTEYNNTQKNLLTGLPSGMGGMISDLAVISPDLAYTFMVDNTAPIAAYSTYHTVIQYLDFVENIVSKSSVSPLQKNNQKAVLKKIDAARKRVNREYAEVKDTYGTVSDIVRNYHLLLSVSNLPKSQLPKL